jgi:hypothetical protein
MDKTRVLRLKRETLRQLTGPELQEVGGGTIHFDVETRPVFSAMCTGSGCPPTSFGCTIVTKTGSITCYLC